MPLLATKSEQNNYVTDIVSKISYADIRKKSCVDISGIVAVVNHFRSYRINFDITNSVHKIPSILEEFSITDIYYNNYRIDVITTLQDGIAAIPKKHFEYDIMPDFYYVINLQSDFTTFKTLGYLRPEDVLNARSDNRFYYPKDFLPAEELIKFIQKPREKRSVIGSHRDCEALFLRFYDHSLSYSYKKSFIKHILSCPECSKKLSCFDNFNDIAKTAIDYPELTEKYYKRIMGVFADDEPRNQIDVKAKIKDISIGALNLAKNMINKIGNLRTRKELLNIQSSQNEDDFINLIFNDEVQKEKFDINTVLKRKKIGALILVPVLLFCFITFGIIKISSHRNEQELPEEEFVDDNFAQTGSLGDDFSEMWDGEISEPAEIAQITNQVNKISWEIPKKLSSDETYIKFLQISGKNIQINLQNDLLVARSIPTNRAIKINVVFKNYGSIVSLKTIKGSGSEEIDNIIEKTVFNAFSYVRPPKVDIKNVDLTLLIEL